MKPKATDDEVRAAFAQIVNMPWREIRHLSTQTPRKDRETSRRGAKRS